MVKKKMNKTQKIIKTFFLTLFVSIVCMCSTVFAASEPIGSINYPIGLKTEYPFNFESKYSYFQAGNTRVLSLTVNEYLTGAAAQSFVQSKKTNAPSATSETVWHVYRLTFKYYSSSKVTDTIDPSNLLNSYMLCNTKGEEVTALDYDFYNVNDKVSYKQYVKNPGESLTFNYAILLNKSDGYPVFKIHNYIAPDSYMYISLDPNKENKIDICNAKATVGNKSYTGKAVTPSFKLTYKQADGTTKTLVKDVDYTVSYGNRTKVGLGTIKFKGKGNFAGVKEQNFVIVPTSKNIKVSSLYNTSARLQWSSMYGAKGYKIYKYNTSTKKYVYWKDWSINSLYISDLKSATIYKYKIVAYYNVLNPRTLKNSKKDFAYITISFSTRPDKVKITKFTKPAKRTVYLTWNKAARVSGYQVIVYKKSGLKDVVKTYYTKGTSKKITGLSSGKWYYVAVRPYKTFNNKKIYSDSYYYNYTKIK